MRIKGRCAMLALLLASVLLTGCSVPGTTQTDETQVTTEATEETTEPEIILDFTVEPNAIEGLTMVEQMVPLGDNYLMIGLNEHGGKSAVLYDPGSGEAQPKLMKRLSEVGGILSIVTDEMGNLHVFYGLGEDGSDRYVEVYDTEMNLIEEMDVTELTEETVDYPTMQIDKDGNRYFLGWDLGGNHEVWVYDKEMQFLGSIRGEMTVGDAMFTTADGTVYLRYGSGAEKNRLARIDPVSMSFEDVLVQDFPVYHNAVIRGTGSYDFFLNTYEALYGIDIESGKTRAVIDWSGTVFKNGEIRGVMACPDGSYLVSNTGEGAMEMGTWKMVVKE